MLPYSTEQSSQRNQKDLLWTFLECQVKQTAREFPNLSKKSAQLYSVCSEKLGQEKPYFSIFIDGIVGNVKAKGRCS
jgi:hypothetical protein